MSQHEYFTSEIKYLGHVVYEKGISHIKQKVKAITDLALAINVTEVRH